MAIKLKKYQEKALEVLKTYLERARYSGAESAYKDCQYDRFGDQPFKPYQSLKGLESSPYVCLRLPTGGGKTLLSAHTVRLAGESYIENEYPLTLWLVPSDTIKQQTLETLKNPDNANRQVLEQAFEGRFRVFDIADFATIRPQDIRDGACVIVGTFQALRVDKTEGRKVYSHNENLEPHFAKISAKDGMEKNEETGEVKFSFANLLYFHRPLVIVDEAHNAKSELSIEVLNRVNASCVVEYTATPAKNSNVLYGVSAAELKAEQMIKLPIILTEHISWEQAVTQSIQTRQKLEDLASKDKDYIRPIILFQAENAGQSITVDVLLNQLLAEGIDRKQIAIATGDQRELDQINLFDPTCDIRYVITIQALKEGWDCSFAYVLCSVANTTSPTAVEQLLGRVLRMPYAQNRTQEDLNKAYAHVSRQSWPHAVTKLHERLVSMGFEEQEAEEFIYAQPGLGIDTPEDKVAPFEVPLESKPDLEKLDLTERVQVTVEEASDGTFTLKVDKPITKEFAVKLAKVGTTKADRDEIAFKGKLVASKQEAALSPSQKGEVFSIPQLCLNLEGDVELAEVELCLDASGWNLLDYPTTLTADQFAVIDEAKQFKADLQGKKILITELQNGEQLELSGIKTAMNDLDLVRWLDKRLRQPDVKQEILLEWLRRMVKNLQARGDLDMAKILRGKFLLEKVLQERIKENKKLAYKKGYQTCMFGPNAIATVEPDKFTFTFDPDNYPVNLTYNGPIGYSNHYYPRIGMMNGEEAECAQALDRNPLIKFWVRNLERQDKHSFWLATSTDKFYPDFVAKLKDGRLLVVEYKGAHLANDDTNEKELIGKVWAEKSGNIFLMAWKKSSEGWDVYQQINRVLS